MIKVSFILLKKIRGEFHGNRHYMYYYTYGMHFRHKELCQKIIPRLLRRRRGDNKENQARRQTKKPLSPYIQTGNRRHDLQQLQYPHRKRIQHPGRLLRPSRFRKTNSHTTHQTPPYRIGTREIVKKAGYRVTSFQTIT